MNVSEETQTVATEYNGWTNRETWIINLWMTGDQGYYEQLCEIISSHDNLYDKPKRLRTGSDSSTTVSIRVYGQISSTIHLPK